jgi:hypothetical protein
MGLSDLLTMAEVGALRARGPIGKGTPRVIDRLQQKRDLAAQERACRLAVQARDQGRCVVPRCRRRSAHLHHIRYRSLGGRWTTANVCSLCPTHHQLVHAARLVIAGNADTTLTITMVKP